MSTDAPSAEAPDVPPHARVAVVAARFNQKIVDELLAGCLRRLAQHGIAEDRVEVHRVPGAFELPVAAKVLAGTGGFHAIVCLGCVIRGDTPHFDYVAGEAARGIQQVAVTEGLPVIFGVLTTNTEEQALQRTGGSHGHAGERAADAAAEMIALVAKVTGGADAQPQQQAAVGPQQTAPRVPNRYKARRPPIAPPQSSTSKPDPFFASLINQQRGG
jgi:6,7-dimethyl-8-ribityllumazine synthase